MKKNILLALSLTAFMACDNKDDYASNDPNARPDAPTCYDVNDTKQTYATYFSPKDAWVGDPMPFYDNGTFYVYYLYDQRPAGATFHPWHLATTSDFITYEDKGEAIACGTADSQEKALGTGSLFKDGNTYYAFYTAHNAEKDPKEWIYLAKGTDPLHLTKDTSFAFRAPDGYDRNEFRDPIVYKEGNAYKMLLSTRADVGSGVWKGVVAKFTSTDMKKWEKDTAEPFFYTEDTAFMVECPDVFTMGAYQYLIYSNIDTRRVQYKYRKVGETAWTTPANADLNDVAFYAGKTVSNGTVRYLVGWVPTRDGYKDGGNYHWGGSLAVHSLTQNADGSLSVSLPKTFESLSSLTSGLDAVTLNEQTKEKVYPRLSKGFHKLTANIKADTATEFGLMFGACGNLSETYRLTLNLTEKKLQLVKVKTGEAPAVINTLDLPITADKQYQLQITHEGSVATAYVNGKTALSFRVYKMNQNPWGIFVSNGAATFSF